LLSLKLLTYPSRRKYTLKFELDDLWDDQPTINFDIDLEQLKEAISKVMRYFLDEKHPIDA
jgi:hypothetical protein